MQIYSSRFFLGVLPFLLCLLTCIGSAAVWAEKPVRLQLKWFHSYQFAGYYAAKELGYYRDAGLDVELVERDPAMRVLDSVTGGETDFGVADTSLVLHRLKGANVVALAAIYQSSPLVLISLAEQNIQSPGDLVGKRVMYQSNTDDAVITAMFSEYGLETNDYTFVPQNFDNYALYSGEVDAMAAYITNQPYLYLARGDQVNILNPTNYGIDFYGDMLFTRQSLVESDPEMVIAFREASLKGWQYALDHPDKLYDWLQTKYVSTNVNHRYQSKAQYDYAVSHSRRMIKPRLVELGNINPSRFRRLAQIYQEQGYVENAENIDGLYYGAYIAKEQHQRWLRILGITALVVCVVAALLLAISLQLKRLIRQRTAELETALQAKQQFFSNMSHELRTPLNSIIGYTRRILKTKTESLDDQSQTGLEAVLRNGEHLLALVNDILDLSRLESNNLILEYKNVNIQALIDECVDDLRPLAEEKGLSLFKPEHYPDMQLHADPMRAKQVLTNLLANAIKYTNEGHITLGCERCDVHDQHGVAISVTDTGIGLSEDNQKSLFSQFAQYDDNSRNILGYGTGLGLSVSAELMRLHGGRIDCTSREQVGSTFTAIFPLRSV